MLFFATTFDLQRVVAWAIGFICLYGIVRFLTTRKQQGNDTVNWSPLEAVAITLALYFGAQILAGITLGLIAGGMGWNDQRLSQELEGPAWQFLYVLIVDAISIGLLYVFMRRRKTNWAAIGWVKPRLQDVAYALTGFAIYFGIYALIVINLVSSLLPQIDTDQKQELGFETTITGPELIFVFISLAILPPLIEEIMARGFLYTGLRNRLPVIWAAVITSIIFAAAHLQWGSGNALLWTAAIDTLVLSFVLVWLRHKTGSLWPGIGLHFIKNGMAFLALYVFKIT